VYRSTSLNEWYNGVRFSSLASAKSFADNAAKKGHTVDILTDIDNVETRLVYTADGRGIGLGKRGNYKNG